MKKVCLLVFCLLLQSSYKTPRKNNVSSTQPRLVEWNIYGGRFNEYWVIIDESRYSTQLRMERVAHISQEPFGVVGVTGHDYDGDGEWDEIFYCGIPESTYGCNSIIIKTNFDPVWEPCPKDSHLLNPFDFGDIVFAKHLLDDAIAIFNRREFQIASHKY